MGLGGTEEHVTKVFKVTTQKMKFFIKDYFSKSADLVTFTKEIVNAKLHFLYSELYEFEYKELCF